MSLYRPPCVFGSGQWDTTPAAWNFLGRQGFWRVPLAWFCYQEDDNIWTSPNFDFTEPLYRCYVNNDGYMVFQSQSMVNPPTPNPVNRIPFPVTSANGVASYNSTVSPSEVWAFRDTNGKIASVRIIAGQPSIIEKNYNYPTPLNLIAMIDTATGAPKYWRVVNGVATLSAN